MNDDQAALSQFGGVARLFPLPNVVLFPHVIQPLHIFEPRYRQMTTDALAGDQLICLVLLQPGWEEEYEGKPPLHSVACLGRILDHQRLPDGRFNLLLRGLSRARIVQEVEQLKEYRCARLELLEDAGLPGAGMARKLRRMLGQRVRPWLPAQSPILEQFDKLFQSELPLGALTDRMGFVLPVPVEMKQALLEELDVEDRVKRLMHHLETSEPEKTEAPKQIKFPPDFSEN